MRAQFWPAIADILHQPLSDIDRMTIEEFDTAVEYVKRKVGGHGDQA